jgi:hypothetical protein
VSTLWSALEALAFSEHLRHGRWSYALVSAAHILGIALLLGAVMPLNLRLMDLAWRGIPLATVQRLLRPAAATGLAVAIVSGFLLFSVNATDYAATRLFRLKMALVLAGTLHALLNLQSLSGSGRWQRRRAGALSAVIWLSALICGRFLGFL